MPYPYLSIKTIKNKVKNTSGTKKQIFFFFFFFLLEVRLFEIDRKGGIMQYK